MSIGGGAAIATASAAKSPAATPAVGSIVSSGGERFLGLNQTKILGAAGHYTFSATWTNPTGKAGGAQVTFDVTASTYTGFFA